MKKFASSLAAREPGYPHILYDPYYTALAYRGRRLVISRMQGGLNEIIDDTWNKLLALSGNTKIEVTVPPLMCEDLRSTEIGDTFIKHVATEPPTLPLLSEMAKCSRISLLRPTGLAAGNGAKFAVDPSASQEFFHLVKPIVEAIAFLIHSTGSGPLRLSEVVDDRFCNGSSPRNLLISHGLVFLLRTNLKTSTTRGCRSTVIHFPPEKVVELLIYYLAIVRPVEVFLTAALGWTEQHATYSQFLYVVKGRQLTPRELSVAIAQYTERYFGCRLTGLDLRHVLVNIQGVFLPPIVDPSVQKFGDSQAGHSTRVANHSYGQRIDHLPGEQASLFDLSFHWCKKLHSFFGLGPETVPNRPIPYIHAPREPTWWSPSEYAPPQHPSTNEIMNFIRMVINSDLSSSMHELALRCERVLTEATFRAFSASTVTMASNDLHRNQFLPTTSSEVHVVPSAIADVGLRLITPLALSNPFLFSRPSNLTSLARYPFHPWPGEMTSFFRSCRSIRNAMDRPLRAIIKDAFCSRFSPVNRVASSRFYPPVLGSLSRSSGQFSPRAQGSPSLLPPIPLFADSLLSRRVPSGSSTWSGATGTLPTVLIAQP